MLTRLNTWPAFSNNNSDERGDLVNSLEAIHNIIHNLVGGEGHMTDVGVTGIVLLAFSFQPERSSRIRF